ncbi:zinc-finger homeodomain protein 6-like [Hibiscus syriacus]|uniref:zinc-finger homeodomain protein 6-like n=1 Tax=Hibiscus syriacus TaxID=106335 RepID=UPI001922144A|nr:zinc-finger homeodomain protein 6-like [Hibiscus syriacus]
MVNNHSYSSAAGERRRDETVHGDPNPPQTLMLNPRRDPDPNPASIAINNEAATAAATRSSLKSPPQQPPTSQLQPDAGPTSAAIGSTPLIRYRECLKNHAASMGGHVVDGCGEFMPSGEDDTPEAMKCAACNCHRSFHRKEINGESQYAPSSYYYNLNGNNRRRNAARRLDPQQPTPLHHHHQQRFPPLLMNFGGGGGGPAESWREDLNMFDFNGGEPSHPHSSKKRFRTKFSQEQKDKMMEFADQLGWRIQKQDVEDMQRFCDQVGVKRQVFKVWMHNNKQAMKRKM